MATVSFNPSTIRTPTFQSHKPTSSFTSHTNSIKFSYGISHLFQRSSRNHFQPHTVSGSSVSVSKESEIDDEEENPTKEICFLDPEVVPESISDWELDFCSRPILDIRGKKIWELLVCDDSLSLQYTKFFPNNVINSITLKDAILSITDELGIPIPRRVRFFRSQMQTIITKACSELSIKPIPSKRCISLLLWIEERYETVYMRHPGFQKGAKPLLAIDNLFPMNLPEHLFGEKWAFVQLPFSALKVEILSIGTKIMFGSSLDLDLLGIEIDDSTLIPGLAIASSRAKALAGWMNGLEICSVEADSGRGSLLLSVGILKRYIYVTYKKTNKAGSEAEAWEAEKKRCGGLHFIAVQPDLESDDCVGFWLLLDMPPPPL